MTDVTESSVTLVAQINPNDSEGEYEFRLVQQGSPPAFRGEPIPGGRQVHQGRIGAGEQTVSAVITDLQPGHLYWYVLVVTNSEQRTKTGDSYFSFHYSGGFPQGIGGAPYEAEIPEWAIDLSEEESAQTLREYEAKQRQAAKEREEQQAKEAAIRAAEAAALKRREEEEAAAETAVRVRACITPALKGDTLIAARRALVRAHCRLGKVSRPHRPHGVLVVTKQAPGRGKRLASGAAVTVTLGSAQSKRDPNT